MARERGTSSGPRERTRVSPRLQLDGIAALGDGGFAWKAPYFSGAVIVSWAPHRGYQGWLGLSGMAMTPRIGHGFCADCGIARTRNRHGWYLRYVARQLRSVHELPAVEPS